MINAQLIGFEIYPFGWFLLIITFAIMFLFILTFNWILYRNKK
jgi:hypothetical protein